MKNIIFSIAFFLAILMVIMLLGGASKIFGQEAEEVVNNKVPQISELDKYKLKSQVLEASNLSYQVQELSRERDDAVRKANEMIEGLFTIYKVDKKDFNLDIQNQVFTPVKK